MKHSLLHRGLMVTLLSFALGLVLTPARGEEPGEHRDREEFDWEKFPHTRDFEVPAIAGESNPVKIAKVTAGEKITLYLEHVTWTGGGTKTGKFTDWRGYRDRYEKNHLPWMALIAAIGKKIYLPDKREFTFTAAEDGELVLFCNDDNPDGNKGRGKVTVKIEKAE